MSRADDTYNELIKQGEKKEDDQKNDDATLYYYAIRSLNSGLLKVMKQQKILQAVCANSYPEDREFAIYCHVILGEIPVINEEPEDFVAPLPEAPKEFTQLALDNLQIALNNLQMAINLRGDPALVLKTYVDTLQTAIKSHNLPALETYLGQPEKVPFERCQQAYKEREQLYQRHRFQVLLARRVLALHHWYAVKHIFGILWNKYREQYQQQDQYSYDDLMEIYNTRGLTAYNQALISTHAALRDFLAMQFENTCGTEEGRRFILDTKFTPEQKKELAGILERESYQQQPSNTPQLPESYQSADSEKYVESKEDKSNSMLTLFFPSQLTSAPHHEATTQQPVMTTEEIQAWLKTAIQKISEKENMWSALGTTRRILLAELDACKKLNADQTAAFAIYNTKKDKRTEEYRNKAKSYLQGQHQTQQEIDNTITAIINSNIGSMSLDDVLRFNIEDPEIEDVVENSNLTLVHLAVKQWANDRIPEHLPIVPCLLRHGMSFYAKNASGKTPRQYAGLTEAEIPREWTTAIAGKANAIKEEEQALVIPTTEKAKQALKQVQKKLSWTESRVFWVLSNVLLYLNFHNLEKKQIAARAGALQIFAAIETPLSNNNAQEKIQCCATSPQTFFKSIETSDEKDIEMGSITLPTPTDDNGDHHSSSTTYGTYTLLK